MRFLLLARARTTGFVRLLSDRAYDSRSAAVDAATATAHALVLGDDEVLAVDLDAAGPVLVLRIPGAAPLTPPTPKPIAVAASGLFAPTASTSTFVAPSVVGSTSDPETVRPVAFDPEPAVRLQPRFPLFGVEDDTVEEGLAETLRRVARRMELDLTTADSGGEWTVSDDSWDARTLEDYALPDDTRLSGAQEEGRLRIEAAAEMVGDEGSAPSDDYAYAPLADADADDLSDEESADDEYVACGPTIEDAADARLDADPIAEIPSDFGFWSEEAGAPPGDPDPEPFAHTDPADEPRVLDASDDAVAEPVYYRPSGVDFALWVCADCVYQRTCRKAGILTPSTCGTFQWRSA